MQQASTENYEARDTLLRLVLAVCFCRISCVMHTASLVPSRPEPPSEPYLDVASFRDLDLALTYPVGERH